MSNVTNNFISYVQRHINDSPEDIALRVPTEWNAQEVITYQQFTYGQLGVKIAFFQQGLQSQGYQSGDRVVVLFPPGADLYCMVLAMMGIGVIPVFIDMGMGLKKVLMAIEDSQATGLISLKRIKRFTRLFKVTRRLDVYAIDDANDYEKLCGVSRSGIQVEPKNPNDHCLISFTSGSTGRPKGADRTHSSLIHQHLALLEEHPLAVGEPVMSFFPVAVLHGLCSGVESVVPALDWRALDSFSPSLVLSQINAFNVKVLGAAPAAIQALVNELECQSTSCSLRLIVVGGAVVPPTLCQQLVTTLPEASIQVIYGSTESEPISAIEAKDCLKHDGQGVLVGQPCHAAEVRILKHTHDIIDNIEGRELPQGEVGELVVKGKHVLSAYIDNESATKENKIPSNDGLVWHRTGDMAYLNSKGEICLVGRVKDIVTLDNHQIHPFSIELAVDECQGVNRAAFIQLDSGEAYIAVEGNAADSVVLEAAGLNPDQVSVICVDSIPVDKRHFSKIDRPLLRDQIKQQVTPGRFIVSLNRVDVLTLSGLVFASIGMGLAIQGAFAFSLAFLYIAMLTDALDGIWARKRGITRSFGRYLDGFVDQVDYLIAPSLFLYLWGFSSPLYVMILVVFMASGIIRLSVFNDVGNVENKGNLGYLGMPVFWSLLLLGGFYILSWVMSKEIVFCLIAIAFALMSFLMVYRATFFKFKKISHILMIVFGGFITFVLGGLLGG